MKIETTADGSNSLRHPIIGELYHSDRGAVGESMHVFISAGLNQLLKNNPKKIKIFEAGLGTGLNAWLTLQAVQQTNTEIEYHTAELYPIDTQTAAELNFTQDPKFMQLHTAEWNNPIQITPKFTLHKHQTDLTKFDFEKYPDKFNLVYYDAFAPDTQPELWSEELFGKLIAAMTPQGILVTYTAKGSVKKALREAGFTVTRLPGALGKRHMVRAERLALQNDSISE